MRDAKFYTVMDAIAVRAIVDSTDASPINVQVTGHGFVTGDKVTINGHTVNTNANGTWTVTRVDANNFTLDGSTATGGGAGGATGCAAKQAKMLFVQDHKYVTVSIATDGGGDAAMTVKCVGTLNETIPDFAEARTVANSYEFLNMQDLNDSSVIDGDTGFVVAAADDYRQFAVTVRGMQWITFLPTAGTQGEITIKACLFSQSLDNE